MTDIVSITTDIGLFDAQTARAANLLSIQAGSLEYEPTLGIDLKYFLSESFQFQNDSFKAYLIQVLANSGINVASVADVIENLFVRYVFELTPAQTSTGLVAR